MIPRSSESKVSEKYQNGNFARRRPFTIRDG